MFIYPVADGMQFFSFHRVWWKVYLKFFPSRKTRRQNSVWVLFEWRYMKKQSVLLERFFFSSFWKSATIIFSPKKKSFVVIFRDTCVNGFYNSAKLFNLLSKLNKSLYKKSDCVPIYWWDYLHDWSIRDLSDDSVSDSLELKHDERQSSLQSSLQILLAFGQRGLGKITHYCRRAFHCVFSSISVCFKSVKLFSAEHITCRNNQAGLDWSTWLQGGVTGVVWWLISELMQLISPCVWV